MEIKEIKEKLESSTIAVSTINKDKPHTIFILSRVKKISYFSFSLSLTKTMTNHTLWRVVQN